MGAESWMKELGLGPKQLAAVGKRVMESGTGYMALYGVRRMGFH